MPELIYNATQVIIQTLLGFYIGTVCFRVLLDWSNVSYANPIFLTVSKITHPFLKPIYNIIPSVNGFDLTSFVFLSFLSMSKVAMWFWWETGYILVSKGLFVLALAEVLNQFIDILLFIIMLFSVMSWFGTRAAPALVEIVLKTCGPLLSLIQRLLPPISNIDFSPLCAIIVLKLLAIFIATPLSHIGLTMMQTTLRYTL